MQTENNPKTEKNIEPSKPGKCFVYGIKFVNSGKIHPYLACVERLRVGDMVIVETDSGENLGMVALSKHNFFDTKRNPSCLKKILRKVNQEDMERAANNQKLEEEGTNICQEKIKERGLSMKLCRVKFSFDSQKATFYFTAEGRVDFRDLVRDLAFHFKTKIEMKQVGVRDQARIIGGCGPCGIKLCCASFLKDFEPVSIKMAKDQNLTLNPVKISGVCGRLMCCLIYEHQTYKDLKKALPTCGTCVKTANGEGKIDRVHLLQEKVTVLYHEEGKRETLPVSEITVTKMTESRPKINKKKKPPEGKKHEKK